MIIFLVCCIVVLICCLFLTIKKLLDVGRQLLEIDNQIDEYDSYLIKTEFILKDLHKQLLQISKHSTINGEPIVMQLISNINIAKNEIQSLIDDIDNAQK